MKISPAGAGATDLVYATLIGGSGADAALAVALDSSNPPNAYIAGTTQSPNFPVNGVVGAYQTSLRPQATANAFLSVVSQNAITGQSALANFFTTLSLSGSSFSDSFPAYSMTVLDLSGSSSGGSGSQGPTFVTPAAASPRALLTISTSAGERLNWPSDR